MDQKSIKKGIVDFGVGVVSYVAVEAIINSVKKLEKEGKLNKKEGEKLMHNAVKAYEKTSSKYAKELQMQVDSLMKASMKASPFATKKEIADLNAKLDRLLSKSMKAKTAKKSSKKRHR